MKIKLFTLAVILFFINVKAIAQNGIAPANCRFNGVTNFVERPGEAQSTGTSGTGANIDVLYHKIYWRINPDSVKYIKGSVQTNFKTIQANVSTISFDLRSGLTIDSIIFRNVQLPTASISHVSNIVTINLGVSLTNNFIDSLVIYYQGTPPAVSGAAQGYQKSTNATAGNFITTLSESYEDRDWWPCKHDMQDKIDSMDVTVNVPWGSPTAADTFWVACNGKMVDSSIIGANRNFTFKSRYPIASYLVFVSVAQYNRYYRSVNIGAADVPVVYNLFKGKPAATYTSILTAMDKLNLVLQAYSAKIGAYPFKNEKHGFYDGLLGAGGMEHQTFSGIATGGSLTSISLLAHELMHQWFGDNVSFATWNDLWLAEGFANYGEPLAAELVPSLNQNAFAIRNSIKSSALSSTVSAWIPNSNTATSNLIWNSAYGGAVYTRGTMVVSMLRAIAGDTKFFQALTNYQTNLAGKSATTDSLKNYFNTILGRDIAVFFNDYVGGSGLGTTPVGGRGNPINTINWNTPSTNKLAIEVASQTQSASSNVTYYRGPVVLHIKGSTALQDTTINFFDWGGGNLSYAGNGLSTPISGNLLMFDLSFTPVTVLYDDSARTLSTGTTVFVPTLAAGSFSFNNATAAVATCVAPASMNVTLGTNSITGFTNPVTISVVSGLPAGTTLSFSVNPVIPGNSTIATLNNTNTLSPGTYNINLQGIPTAGATQNTTITFIINPGTNPTITTQPLPQIVCDGASATFSIVSPNATSYQWQVSTNNGTTFTNIIGANSNTYIIPAVTSSISGNQYGCIARTVCGATGSTIATLVVNAVNITTQPQSASICTNQSNTFCVVATGNFLSYQWQTSTTCAGPWLNIAGATSDCFTLLNATTSAAYRCSIKSSTCVTSTPSNCVTLTINSGVTITSQPTDVEICAAGQASFSVATNSTTAINYQWQISTDAGLTFTNITSANAATFNITNATVAMNNNRYRCILSNGLCTTQTNSNAAKLLVRALPIANLSASPFTTLLPLQSTLLTATSTASNGGTFVTNWFYNNAPLSVSGNTYPVSIDKTGTYYVTVKETNTSGLQCSNTSAIVVITATESNKLFISPNPNNGSFNVSFYNSTGMNAKRSISIFDSKGALLYKKEFTVTGFYTLLPVNIKTVSSGNYFVLLFDEGGKKLSEGKVQIK